MTKTYITKSFEETQKLGEKIGKELKGVNILALYGNLGSGKTTFAQGLAKGLGVKQKIISPTFIITRKYDLVVRSQGSGIRSFYHIDLYRIENEKDIEGLGLEEILNDPSNIVAIEWPEKIESLMPQNRINLYFEYMSNDERRIEIK